MNIQTLNQQLFALSEHEQKYKNGDQTISHIPFKFRKINGKEYPYVPMKDHYDYKTGPLLGIKKHSRYHVFPAHCHEGIEINYMYSGFCQQHINGDLYELKTGQTIFLSCDTVHSIEPLGEEDILINITLNSDFLIANLLNRFSCSSILTLFFINSLTDSIQHDDFLFFNSEKSERLHRYIEDLLCEWLNPSIITQDIKENLLSLIISELVIVYKDSFTFNLDRLDSAPILAILRFVEENYRTHSLPETAKIFYLNPNYLSNLLKRNTGFSYKELVQQQKISAAEQLLRSSNLSIIEIAHMVGYENVSFFYRKFKEKNHCLPNDYRNLQKTKCHTN